MSDDRFKEWEGDLPDLSEEDQLSLKVLDAVKVEGSKTTHVAVVVSRVDSEGFETFSVYGGPEQPRWVTNSLLERGYRHSEHEAAQATLMNQLQNAVYEVVMDDGEDDVEDE